MTAADDKFVSSFLIFSANKAWYFLPIICWQTFNSLHAGNFFMHFRRLLIFFKIKFLEKIFKEYYQSVKQFVSRSGLMFHQS